MIYAGYVLVWVFGLLAGVALHRYAVLPKEIKHWHNVVNKQLALTESLLGQQERLRATVRQLGDAYNELVKERTQWQLEKILSVSGQAAEAAPKATEENSPSETD